MTWAAGPYVAFDVETTGVDVEADRIVTAALVFVEGKTPLVRTWLIDPGVEIPEGATAVHGVSTAQARAEGVAPATALAQMATALCADLRAGVPVVAMNASFDLTILDRELLRYGLGGLGERLGGYGAVRPVLDPFVLDREVDKYRRGKRTLTALCEFYGVDLGDDAHNAAADALAACRLMWKLATRYPREIGARPVDVLHDLQVKWHAARQADFADYLRRKGEDASDVDGSWPIRVPKNGQEAVA
ncbi:exonuclease domain-containing protein [Kribbella deserti]|uniref:Exonuclease domain-containing protein n=1 Tax=Kribbella deserti TaxID=1926257 RepID=A0ABV6QNA5_9ACTN